MRLVQVCNVGNLCGGTAACVWTMTRALPGMHHSVLCLGSLTRETANAFAPVEIRPVRQIDDNLIGQLRPDLLVLHNTSPQHVGSIRSCYRLVYAHSRTALAAGDAMFACSQWLSAQLPGAPPVLYQPVPLPPRAQPATSRRSARVLADELIIGRFCTPQARKWPAETIPFYARLASRLPQVQWEFVGCPDALQADLRKACHGRARFHPANWQARSHLWNWHGLLYHHPQLTESFGRTVAESMRAGCIPIVDCRGGFCEQIESGSNGFLCDREEEFLSAFESLSNPLQRWRMSAAARESANAKFSLHAFALRFRNALGSCLAASPIGGAAAAAE